jgi:hypothetical protein
MFWSSVGVSGADGRFEEGVVLSARIWSVIVWRSSCSSGTSVISSLAVTFNQ